MRPWIGPYRAGDCRQNCKRRCISNGGSPRIRPVGARGLSPRGELGRGAYRQSRHAVELEAEPWSERALVQIAGSRKASRVVLSRTSSLGATAFHTAGASRPWTTQTSQSELSLTRMRCINSIPAIVIAAVAKPLKPSIVAIRCFHAPMVLLDQIVQVLRRPQASSRRAASHRLSAHAPRGETRHSHPE